MGMEIFFEESEPLKMRIFSCEDLETVKCERRFLLKLTNNPSEFKKIFPAGLSDPDGWLSDFLSFNTEKLKYFENKKRAEKKTA